MDAQKHHSFLLIPPPDMSLAGSICGTQVKLAHEAATAQPEVERTYSRSPKHGGLGESGAALGLVSRMSQCKTVNCIVQLILARLLRPDCFGRGKTCLARISLIMSWKVLSLLLLLLLSGPALCIACATMHQASWEFDRRTKAVKSGQSRGL